jgi:hypothetical protein
MRRRRRINTGTVYKWKSRRNIDGSNQTTGISYWETNAPVTTWPTIRLILVHTLRQIWHTRQIEFAQAYPQADIEEDLNVQIPNGFEIKGSSSDEFVFKLHNSSPLTMVDPEAITNSDYHTAFLQRLTTSKVTRPESVTATSQRRNKSASQSRNQHPSDVTNAVTTSDCYRIP